MKKFFITLHLICLSAFGKAPSNPYIDKQACPFECCKYKKWKVINDTILYDKLGGAKSIGFLKKNSYIDAITVEVHVEPNEVEIVFNKGKYLKGDRIYLLTPQSAQFHLLHAGDDQKNR